jgi:type VI secretion system protein ImpJ
MMYLPMLAHFTPPAPPHRIQWHEGMLLSPQHFQQEGARLDALIAWQHLAAHPLAWGLRRLELDEGLLANGMVRIKVLEAVMPDGMAVTWSAQDAHAQELQLDLAPWAAQLEDGEVMVYLTVGYARTWRQPGQPSRFRPLPGQLEEDEVSEALPVDIPRAAINLALAAGALPSSVFVSLPLMTVQKDKEVFRRGPFVPPSLVLEANNELRQRAQALAAHLRSKAAYLVKQTSDPSSRVEDRLALLENRARLGSLVASLPVLEALLQAPGLSPYALYLSLCAQLGPLTMLRPGAVPIKLSPWVQADPRAAIAPLLDALEDLVGEVSQEWHTTQFTTEAGRYVLVLDPAWTGPRLVVGLRGRPERDLVDWMTGAVIGSQAGWESLTDRRVLGAARQRIDDAPELGLRSSAGYTLFSIDASEGLVVPGQPLVIGNLREIDAPQRPHEMVIFVKG